MPKPDTASHHDAHSSKQHICRLSRPIMLSNITVPLIGVVEMATMGRLDDLAHVGGVDSGPLDKAHLVTPMSQSMV